MYIDNYIISFDDYNEINFDVSRGTKPIGVGPVVRHLTNGQLEVEIFLQSPDKTADFYDKPVYDVLIFKLVGNGKQHIADDYSFVGTIFVNYRPLHVFYKCLEIPDFKETAPSLSNKIALIKTHE